IDVKTNSSSRRVPNGLSAGLSIKWARDGTVMPKWRKRFAKCQFQGLAYSTIPRSMCVAKALCGKFAHSLAGEILHARKNIYLLSSRQVPRVKIQRAH